MDVITFGETMAVLTPDQMGKMRYATNYKRTFAGAESNVAIALANLGTKVAWISQLGKDEMGHAIHSFVAGHLIDTSNVTFTDQAPTSLLLKEKRHADLTNVYYYRKHSAFALVQPATIQPTLFNGAKILHLTGITPLLSESAYEACLKCIELARANQMKIVFDPNLRMKLLDGEEHLTRLRHLAANSDYFLPNVTEAKLLYPLQATQPQQILAEIKAMDFPNVVLKDGARGTYYANDSSSGFVETYAVEEVDPVGAGDAFAAGFIHGILQGESLQDAVRKANAMGAQVIQVAGDIENLPSLSELIAFMNRNLEEDNVNR